MFLRTRRQTPRKKKRARKTDLKLVPHRGSVPHTGPLVYAESLRFDDHCCPHSVHAQAPQAESLQAASNRFLLPSKAGGSDSGRGSIARCLSKIKRGSRFAMSVVGKTGAE